MGNACPHPRETMVWGGVWAWDSKELIHTEWAWANEVKPIANKLKITITYIFFIIISFFEAHIV